MRSISSRCSLRCSARSRLSGLAGRRVLRDENRSERRRRACRRPPRWRHASSAAFRGGIASRNGLPASLIQSTSPRLGGGATPRSQRVRRTRIADPRTRGGRGRRPPSSPPAVAGRDRRRTREPRAPEGARARRRSSRCSSGPRSRLLSARTCRSAAASCLRASCFWRSSRVSRAHVRFSSSRTLNVSCPRPSISSSTGRRPGSR